MADSFFTDEKVVALILEHYGLSVTLKPLPGELDLNFRVSAADGSTFCFKIANAAEVQANIELQHAAMDHLESGDFGLEVPRVVKDLRGNGILLLTGPQGEIRLARLLTWVDGRVFAEAKPHSPGLLFRFGELCGKLSRALSGFDHPAAHRHIKWDPRTTEWVAQHLHLFSGSRRALSEHFLQLFREVMPAFKQLRTSVNYNDANDFNVLISHDTADPVVPGVIDFGDLVHTHTVNELAIGLAYAVMHKPDPLEAAMHVVRGYHATFPLTEDELAVLFPLMGARLLISVTCSGINLAAHPDNTYLQISDRPAWELLEKLSTIHPHFAHACFRHACGMEPVPARKDFERWITTVKPVMPVELPAEPHWLDLSIGSSDLGTMSDILDASILERTVEGLRRQPAGGLALGSYDEARPIYSTDAYMLPGNDGPKWRSIHIGLDIFCDPGTPVRAAFSGVIHAFTNNAGDRNYGPTVILRHDRGNGTHFFTLYGHLSLSSLDALAVGSGIRAGEVIGAIGAFRENGNWPPHLHFQVMLDLLGNDHDFPGVCTPDLAPVWRSICPDPWKMLTGQPSPVIPSRTKEEIVGYRRQHLGKNLSISYKDPIIMLRGDRQYMVDHLGRRYLDTVNNVAHVGHEHPRVVRAGQRQMAVLNTNTRYLHGNIVTFTEELLATVPAPLDVVFLVNSGSEANELAIRLARTYTGQRDMIVSQTGYHGNTNMCVEVSSYKFDGPGGKGAEPHIHVVPMPDTYRGLYRAEDPGAGMKYAAHVGGAISKIRTAGRGVAALLFESVISCGGQVELPEGFLKESYRMVRATGGLCIADEVQTGCGRAGDHFWAFEAHGVVPDILTIGKPIGNGHPLGAVVTTQAVADAFRNGMEYFNTFGGNPVSCAVGTEVLRVVREEGLQRHALETGNFLKDGLRELMREFPIIGDVRGPGLFIGFELVKDPGSREPATAQASWLANRMRDKGILMSTDGPHNNVLKIKPPMVFDRKDAEFLLEAARQVFREDMMACR